MSTVEKNTSKNFDFEFDSNKSLYADGIVRPSLNYWQDAFRRLKKNKVAIGAGIILIFIIFMTIFGPSISGHSFTQMNRQMVNKPPSAEHWFGTDRMGRDLFTRAWVGGRVSIIIGVVGAIVNVVLGLIYGGVSGFFGGRVDTIMMRCIEILGSIPKMILIILISLILKPGIPSLIVALTIAGWIGTARMVRGQVLQLKEMDFVTASRALGASPFSIIKEHLVPNVMSTIIVLTTIQVPSLMFAEAFLSFIGLGVSSPNTSWGAMCAEGQQVILFYPYQLIFPTILISLTMLCFNLLGDGLRDALDPKLRR